MNTASMFPSKFLKAADLENQPSGVILTVSTVTFEGVDHDDGSSEQRPVVHFEETKKGLILNRTNANALQELFGDETDNWLGKKIKLIRSTTDFRGKRVPCLRMEAPELPAITTDVPDDFSPDDNNTSPFAGL